MMTYFPPTPGMVAIATTTRAKVWRRTQVGVSDLNTPLFDWRVVAEIECGIMPRSGGLRMATPGVTLLVTHQLYTPYQLARDGKPVLRPRDIIDDGSGMAYLVNFVGDEGGAHVYFSADLLQGTMNRLQDLAAQG